MMVRNICIQYFSMEKLLSIYSMYNCIAVRIGGQVMNGIIVINSKIIVLRWFSVRICKYKPGYKSHDLL